MKQPNASSSCPLEGEGNSHLSYILFPMRHAGLAAKGEDLNVKTAKTALCFVSSFPRRQDDKN